MMWAKSQKNSGFTLLELLIVLALSSMIILGVYQGYFILKNNIIIYYQNIRLQNNIKTVSHEFYGITDKAGKFGCAKANQITYLHWSKNLGLVSRYLIYEHNKPLLNTIVLKKSDNRFKKILPQPLYSKLKSDSDILYTTQAEIFNKSKKNKEVVQIYADCQDIFFVGENDNVDYFYQHAQYEYVGNLSVDCYFIALSKRINNQSQPIYSLYRHNNILGTHEILEGVEALLIESMSENSHKIKILINSVEGNPPLKKWFTIVI